jgi:hypothetical protein
MHEYGTKDLYVPQLARGVVGLLEDAPKSKSEGGKHIHQGSRPVHSAYRHHIAVYTAMPKLPNPNCSHRYCPNPDPKVAKQSKTQCFPQHLVARMWQQSAKAKLLTVNFRQPSHEFTFNVGIDLLF